MKLVPMTESEFQVYLKHSIPAYAEEKRKGEGLSQEAALKIAQESFQNLLPEGLKTKDNYLFNLQDEGKNVGILWICYRTDKGRPYFYIYDIEIVESARGKGYGEAAMKALEVKAREMRATSINLHVFGHNKIAQGLYQKMGFQTTNIWMEKML